MTFFLNVAEMIERAHIDSWARSQARSSGAPQRSAVMGYPAQGIAVLVVRPNAVTLYS